MFIFIHFDFPDKNKMISKYVLFLSLEETVKLRPLFKDEHMKHPRLTLNSQGKD